MKPFRSKEWRDAGKGMLCAFYPCTCPATDFAHIRLPTFCGGSQKPPDWMGVDLCHDHHEELGHMNDQGQAWWTMLAWARTQQRRFQLIENGELTL